jgi:hypothetical protein
MNVHVCTVVEMMTGELLLFLVTDDVDWPLFLISSMAGKINTILLHF